MGTNKVVEYIVRHGKQGLFSHANKQVAVGRMQQYVHEDISSGVAPRDLSLKCRTVVFTDHEEVPTGDDAFNARGEVSETDVE